MISAVGHETDFTIADFVAICVHQHHPPQLNLLYLSMNTFAKYTKSFCSTAFAEYAGTYREQKKELEHAKLSLKVSHPSVRLKAQSETLKQYEAQIKRQIMHLIDQKKAQLSIAAAKLEAQSPLKKVGGGYAFLTDENKKPVCSVNQMTPQTTFFAYLSDGIVQADVTKCMPKDKME